MSSSRVAALRRARQRQARIEAATANAIRAQIALDRAIKARSLAAERHDERVRRAEQASIAEVVELVTVCGTAEAVAEILGWNARDVRKVIKSEREGVHDAPDRRRTPRRERLAPVAGGGGDDADTGDD